MYQSSGCVLQVTKKFNIDTTMRQTNMPALVTEMDDAFHYYSLAMCIFQYFLPVLLMTYSYLMVASTIWKQQGSIEVQHSLNATNTRDANLLNGRKKVQK